MRPTLLLVPPDTRPPTCHFPRLLARAAGLEVRFPPPETLPRLNLPGDPERLAAWLLENAPKADLLIVSLETLCLGGMIPARRVDDPLSAALERLELLPRLKRESPRLRILAGGVVVRVAHDDDPLEEKPYYGQHGPALRRYSEAADRQVRKASPESEAALKEAGEAVPPGVLENWLGTRERNHRLHLRSLELARDETLEHLCLTLDDTASYGLAARDRRALEAKTDALMLWPKVDIYPGADEAPLTLLARALQKTPTKVWVSYSSALGAAAELLYEDRPAGELVLTHLRAAGCVPVASAEKADLVLAVNTPARRQAGTQPDFETVDTAARYLPAFVDAVGGCLAAGKPVSVADIAYANGAERRLMTLLDGLPVGRLAGFSAWNTAGNAIGSALAMGVVSRLVKDRAAWTEALFARLVDDALYQGRVRSLVWARLERPDPFDIGSQQREAEELMDELLRPLALELWRRHFADTGFRLVWEKPRLAWPRLFTGVFPFRVET